MTHVFFDSDQLNWGEYFRRQMVGSGGHSMIGGQADTIAQPKIFRGVRYARGYGSVKNIVGSIGRFLLPIAENLMQTGKLEAVGALGNIAADLASGRSVSGAIKSRGKEAAMRMGEKLQQCGKGKKKMVKSANILRTIATMDPENNPKELTKTKVKKRRNDYLDFN